MQSTPSRRAVITGASAGIGAALARALAADGWSLVLAARRTELLEELAAGLPSRPGQSHWVQYCDASERTSIMALAEFARSQFGELDLWVSNAGSGLRHRILEASAEQMIEQYQLNCLSALWAYQAVIPGWLANGHRGQLVDICSLGGKSGYAFNAGYSAAKHGMSALGDTLRQELAGRGIAVTTVYPGPTVSDFGASSHDETGGESAAALSRARSSKSWLSRIISRRQPTEEVVRAIQRALRTRQAVVYPHRGATLGILMNNLLPDLTLRLYARVRASRQ